MLDESGLAKAPDLAKIFDLYNSQTSTVNTLWNIYIAIALGTLGFIYKDPEMRGNWRIKIGFTVGFLVFALSNRTAILRSQNILFAIKTFLHASAVEEGSLNRAAFVIPVGRQGTLGRNALRGFPASQLDLSLARRFQLRERMPFSFAPTFLTYLIIQVLRTPPAGCRAVYLAYQVPSWLEARDPPLAGALVHSTSSVDLARFNSRLN